jgi:Acetyltransferase (GNAT) domain/HEAT repeats/PBS lyase HEAT-like repeat
VARNMAEPWETSPVFAVVLDGSLIGTVNFEVEPPDAEGMRAAMLGYAIGRRWWGRGLATEATRAAMEWAVAEYGLSRVWASTDVRNLRSHRVLEKLGMRRETVRLHDHVGRDGVMVDEAVCGIKLAIGQRSGGHSMHDDIGRLLEQLSSERPDVYGPAAKDLVRNGAAAAVPLSRVCDAATPFSRRAATLLLQIGRDAIEPLIQVLKTNDRDAQRHAIIALQLIRDPSSLPALIDALSTPSPEVRNAAIMALWTLRDPKAVEPLIHVLQNDEIRVATMAAGTLGWIGDRKAIPPLLWALEHRNWQMREAAASALGEIGDNDTLDAVRAHLSDPKPQVRKAVQGALMQFHRRRG